MDGFKERRNSKTPGSFLISKGSPVEPWHSTPVKKNLFAANETPDVSSTKLRGENRTRPPALSLHDLSKPVSSFSFMQDFQTPVNGLEVSTIQRQRLELQLLIAELKDRDQELNTMAAAHHMQLLSWEQDRQRVLILEQRCARLEDELEKRNEVIRALSKRTNVAETREKNVYRELNSTQHQLHELSHRQMNISRHEQDLEERNQSLNSTVMMLSSQVGQLQVREEELSSMLKLKDKDVIEATNHILELSGRLWEQEKSLEELRTRESKTLREMKEHKHCFRESRHENTQLIAELQEKTIENNSQREELIRLKQENQLLKKDITAVELQMMNEDKSWRDELLELSRSKQARAESELLCLRQVCENQQNDLQLLKLNLESARESLRYHEGQRSRESVADLSLLHLDCPSPSHRSRRSSVCLPDSRLSIELCAKDVAHHDNEEDYSSSTTRLQRLLAESQEMVASLESSTKKSVSPTKPQSPTNCDAGCHLQSNHGNGSHSQTFTHSQTRR
ncbi:coiled-coil domain-containing protein 62 [Sinocyclocheilus grahami]|uniref:coiled-coil domain-containing protein 62 n=1 Tax=Sinocyclocheilus grahami TaxID=75366 RepID=UPI0007AD6020|nr:PREDICTED: coiled-coil domain-containing protein 62-like [Sinocyclocheilus grahami]XP_016132682.1 PREDICTED: coiled-coil domain-containing protein 62-like [Sinocyclocheilus grahami]XP_016132683.1 PREDICTED: coiled-coil domain-containing protein 62-like [Sinocyclocheilus grahami]